MPIILTVFLLIGILELAPTEPIADNIQPLEQSSGCLSQATLKCARDRMDIPALRRHGWTTLARICKPIGGQLLEWETWPARRPLIGKSADAPRFWSPEDLTPPHQFIRHPPLLLFDNLIDQHLVDEPYPERKSSEIMQHLFTEVRMHPSAYSHIRDTYKLNDSKVLIQRRNSGSQSIPEFPADAIAVKAVWWPVAHDKPTVLPVWDGALTRNAEAGTRGKLDGYGNDFSRWNRHVAIDPSGVLPVPKELVISVPVWRLQGAPPEPLRPLKGVSIRNFHYLTLSDTDAMNLRLHGPFNFVIGRNPQKDDKLALVGMHVATKELEDWFWMTIWWHDEPDVGESANDRKEVTDVKEPWTNYLMEVAVGADCPTNDRTGLPKAVFNPWLEGGFSNGVNSNCLGCHQRAVLSDNWPDDKDAGQEVWIGKLPSSDKYFNNKMRLDYMWSIHPIRRD